MVTDAYDADDLTDPGGVAYSTDGSCVEFITRLDRWNDGSLHCSKCGRLTEVIDGERRHKRSAP